MTTPHWACSVNTFERCRKLGGKLYELHPGCEVSAELLRLLGLTQWGIPYTWLILSKIARPEKHFQSSFRLLTSRVVAQASVT